MRLDKYLADMNAGTRSELKRDIKKGFVTADGIIVKEPGYHVSAETEIVYKGKVISYEAEVYYMLNKPGGVITATTDPHQKTVLDIINEPARGDLFPVGRLDKDTEGLLIITNNGELAHRLLAPKKHVDKMYYARIKGRVDAEDVKAFEKGLKVSDDFQAMPSRLEILNSADISEVKVTVREGKFHQIKRMFHAVGKEVLYLKRLSMGGLKLDEKLRPGEYRKLTEEETELLKDK